jgi:UDP-glucose 4-epimerase
MQDKLKKTIAIIGGDGFIGKNFTNYFADNNFEVLVIDRHFELATSKPNVSNLAVDIHHTKELVLLVEPADYIIWLVHASVPSTLDESLTDDFNLNILPLIKFLEKSKTLLKLKKFVYLSSGGTIYGDSVMNEPLTELHPQNPISNYGLSKSVAEIYINYLTKNTGFESFILRPSNVFGMFQNLIKPQGIIGFAFKSIYEDKTLDLYDNGKVIRDFIYVMDVAKATHLCIKSQLNSGNTVKYNVGSNEGLTIKEVLDKIEKICNKKLKLNHKASRTFDCSYSVLDNNKIKSQLNWKIETQMDEGLLKVWEWISIWKKN